MNKRPNILLIFTDQQRRDTIGAAGAPWMKTPNLDRLVREGGWFRNAYSPCPVCIPARHNLLTGHHCETTGYYNNVHRPMRRPNVPVYPNLLSDAGYHVGGVGKQHFQPATRTHGFHEMLLQQELPERRCDDAYLLWLAREGLGDVRNPHGVIPGLYHLPQRAVVDEAHHPVTWVADESIAYLRRTRGRPWFLMSSFLAPHPPWAVPDSWRGLYDGVALPAAVPNCRTLPWPMAKSEYFGDHDSAETRRAERAAYCTMISMVDHAVGRILAELEEQGILDETVVIFTSDHGEMLGDRGFHQKSLPYEPSAGIPLVVRAPGRLEPGSVRGEFVDLMDIMPTLLDIASSDYAPYAGGGEYRLEGSSLFDLAANSARDRSMQWSNYGEGRKRWIMQLDHRRKYIFWYNGGIEELYDREDDPGEVRNLIGTPDEPTADLERLRLACFANEARHRPESAKFADGRPVPLPLEPLPENHWDGCKYPRWINMQFARFASGSPEEPWLAEKGPEFEGRQFIREAIHAAGSLDVLKNTFSPLEMQRTFEEFYGYLTHGGKWPGWKTCDW